MRKSKEKNIINSFNFPKLIQFFTAPRVYLSKQKISTEKNFFNSLRIATIFLKNLKTSLFSQIFFSVNFSSHLERRDSRDYFILISLKYSMKITETCKLKNHLIYRPDGIFSVHKNNRILFFFFLFYHAKNCCSIINKFMRKRENKEKNSQFSKFFVHCTLNIMRCR